MNEIRWSDQCPLCTHVINNLTAALHLRSHGMSVCGVSDSGLSRGDVAELASMHRQLAARGGGR